MPKIFRNMVEAQQAFAKAGISFHGIKTLKQASEAFQGRKPVANKPSFPRNITPDNPANPKAFDPKTDGLGDAIAAAKAERDISKKIDLLEQLSAKQFAAMQAESDAINKTDLMRAWQCTQKSLAYATLAEKTASPSAAKIRRLVDFASE